MQAFTPASTVTLSASTTSATAGGLRADNPTMEINNAGLVPVFVRWGTGAQTAVVTDYPVLPGHCKLVNKGTATDVAVITGSGTATVYFTAGAGNL